jgi:Flp pilus assembly protein TadG
MSLRGAAASTDGVAMVEFALVIPVLLIILMGILDTGRAVNAYVTISNASREGARYVSLNPTASPPAVKSNAVVPHSQQLDSASIGVTVSYANVASAACPVASSTAPPAASPPASIPVRVDVTYPWSAATFFLPFVGQVFGNGGPMCASSTVDTVR